MTPVHTRRGHNPLPNGALTVGVGLVLAGVSTYAFLSIAGHALSPEQYSSFAGFWALLFVVAPGIFLPLEQELARATAGRRARGDGGGPVVRRCSLIGATFLLLLLGVCGLAFGVIDSRVLGGDSILMVALMLGLGAYCAEHLARGALSGSVRFKAYGVLLGTEGVYRVGLCAILAIAHVRSPGLYGVAVVTASFAATITGLAGQPGLTPPGSPARQSEVTSALASLLIASLATQFLFNGGTVMVRLLATPSEQRAAGTFLNGRVLAFVPLFLFQAVTAALLPRLSALRSSGEITEFRRTLWRLLLLVAGLGLAGVVGSLLVGPALLRLVFGPAYRLDGRDIALLAGTCTALMAAQTLAQGLIASARYRALVAGWVSGVAAFFAVVLIVQPLLLRVELALLGGGGVAVAVMAVLQPELWRIVPAPLAADLPSP